MEPAKGQVRASKRHGSSISPFLWTFIGALLLTFNQGYTVDMGMNHPLQFVVVQKILSPNLYPNDPFVNQTYYAYTFVLW